MSKPKTIVLWAIQIACAVMFLMASYAKFTGKPEIVQAFEKIGFGQWFRYLTGTIEFTAAILLLVPGFAVFGAALLVPTMVGAVLAHLLTLGGAPTSAVVLLLASGLILYARRDSLIKVYKKSV